MAPGGQPIELRRVPDGKLLGTLTKPTDLSLTLRFSPDGRFLYSIGYFGYTILKHRIPDEVIQAARPGETPAEGQVKD